MGGLCGVVSKDDCVLDLFFGTDYHSHLGTHRGGMTVLRQDGAFRRSIHNIQNAPFRSKFERDIGHFSGKVGIGCISDTDPQPLVMVSKLGTFAIATVGILNNMSELMDELFKSNGAQLQFSTTSGAVGPTEVVSALMATQDTLIDGLKYVQERVKGSCSLLIVDDKGRLYAMRDRWGRTPIILGKKDGAMIALMESCALPNMGYEYVRDIGPGEVVELTPECDITLVAPREKMAICSFLWVYYGFPASSYEGRNVEMMRYRCGGALARRTPVEADAACGIPDSGISHALGYAHEAGIKYSRPFVKYTPTWARSFMPQDQKQREHVASMKLIPIPGLIRDKSLVFCDDSIVRGTQLGKQAAKLYAMGCRETHMRIACPPLVYPCPFINFSRSKSVYDLITRRYVRGHAGEDADLGTYTDPDSPDYVQMVAFIREKLNLTSLAFQRIDDLVKAIGLPEDRLCTYCWTGCDPAVTGDHYHCRNCPGCKG
ncbi:MAG: amidophosphoribosyltransferase [Kiritimatiellia bacterium]